MSLHLKRNRILALVMAFTFAFSLVRPAVVYAQDELPVDAVEQEVEQQVLEQTLALLPAETEVVVLSDAGEVLPLASQEAVEVLIAGDPMWCPEGKLPGDVACTASYTNLSELLSNLGGKTGNGTIYVASDYDSKNANDYGNNFIIDQTGDSFGVNNENKLITAQLSTLDALTIQGGWNFTTNSWIRSSSFRFLILEPEASRSRTGLIRLRSIISISRTLPVAPLSPLAFQDQAMSA